MPTKYITGSRPISIEIISDRRVNDLNDWCAITAHFRVILSMDNMGRIEADPDVFKAMIFPRNKKITTERCEKICQTFHDAGLYFLYTKNGDRFLQSATFSERQKMVGHMKRASILPAPDEKEFFQWLKDVRRDEKWEKQKLETCIDQVRNMLIPCNEHVYTSSNHEQNMLRPDDLAINGQCSEHVKTMDETCIDHGQNKYIHVKTEQEVIKKRNRSDSESESNTEEDPDSLTEPEGAEIQDEGVLVSVHIKSLREKAEKNLDNTSLPKGDRFNKELKSAMEIHGYRNVEEAIKEAVRQNNPRWQYVIGILVNWENERNSRRGK